MNTRTKLAVVLDRDGVINFDSDQYIKSPEEWRPLPGSMQAIADLSDSGFDVFVVTNQSGIARGLFTLDQLHAITAKMLAAVTAAGGRIREVYHCPHHPDDDCDCRKPRAGLLHRVATEYRIKLPGLAVIGDKWTDLQAARVVGARPILVLTGRGQETLQRFGNRVEESYIDLAAAAAALISEVT